jgi:hypothetical protein
MPSSAELLAAITRFVDVTEPTAFALVNGAANETVLIDGIEVPTFAKAIADLLLNSVSTMEDQALSDAQVEQHWKNKRVMPYESLEDANLDIGVHNILFYNTTLKAVQSTT